MGFHPGDDESEEAFDQEFDHLVDEPYAMIFVQRLSAIEKAAEMLREKGYYDLYLNDPQTAGLWDERQEAYRRLCDAGNEELEWPRKKPSLLKKCVTAVWPLRKCAVEEWRLCPPPARYAERWRHGRGERLKNVPP